MADLEEEEDTEVQSVAEIMANMDEYRTQRTAVRVSSSVRPALKEGRSCPPRTRMAGSGVECSQPENISPSAASREQERS